MRPQAVIGSAALLFTTATAWAVPFDDDAAELLRPRDGEPADSTSPWIEVDDEGQPATTHTPSMTTVSGTPTALNGAPYSLTASLYTWTTWGVLSTSTGIPPNPTATASDGRGAFTRCVNPDGDFAPFCRPSHNSTLFVGNTYFSAFFESLPPCTELSVLTLFLQLPGIPTTSTRHTTTRRTRSPSVSTTSILPLT